jgi:arginine repressor
MPAKFAREMRELKLEIRHRDSLLALHAKAAYSMQDTSSSNSSSGSSSVVQCQRSVVLLKLIDTTAGEMTAVTHVLDTKLLARLCSVLEDDDGDILLEKCKINTHASSTVYELTCNGTCHYDRLQVLM